MRTTEIEHEAKKAETRASAQIAVAGFRQIHVWPLALDLSDGAEPAGVRGAFERMCAEFSEHSDDWVEVDDFLDHAAPFRPAGAHFVHDRAEMGASYAEFVYFYDFLQRTLYAAGGDPAKRPIRLWRHARVGSIEFDLWLSYGPTSKGIKTYRATVERLCVYVFDSGAAIVVMETDFGCHPLVTEEGGRGPDRSMTLADAQTISDHLRRVYVPYFLGTTPARVPERFVWKDRAGQPMWSDSFCATSLASAHAFVRQEGEATDPGAPRRRNAPVLDHWRAILAPLTFSGYDGPGPRWRHVLDERIPTMTWISLTGAAKRAGVTPPAGEKIWPEDRLSEAMEVDAARADVDLVNRGDWVRICSADSSDDDPMPYNSAFLEEMEQHAFYDRFAPDRATTSASRILFAGYHFAMVGAGSFFDTELVQHFRRHYFQMVLLANLELASLLVTSSRLTQAVSRLRGSEIAARADDWARGRFMEELEDISEWFLTFVHRYRFNGVSNQIQASEIFAMMREAMRLEGLFTEVRDELQAALAFNSGSEQRRMASNAERLTNVATVGAAVGLAGTFIGMNAVFDPLRALWSGRAEAVDQKVGPVTPIFFDAALVFFVVAAFAFAMIGTKLFFMRQRRSALQGAGEGDDATQRYVPAANGTGGEPKKTDPIDRYLKFLAIGACLLSVVAFALGWGAKLLISS